MNLIDAEKLQIGKKKKHLQPREGPRGAQPSPTLPSYYRYDTVADVNGHVRIGVVPLLKDVKQTA